MGGIGTHGAAATRGAAAVTLVGPSGRRSRADAILIDPSGVSHLALIGRS